MEPIKIVDKITLRQEALRMALHRANAESNIHDALKLAKEYEEYLLGNAELPERDNGMEKYLHEMKDILFKKHNPWISADSKMKPVEKAEVLVMCKDYNGPLLAEYLGGDNWDVFDADVTKNTLQGEIEVIAWMPIPPFVEPLKL